MKYVGVLLILLVVDSQGQSVIYYNQADQITIPLMADHFRVTDIDEELGVFVGIVEEFRIDSTKRLTMYYDSTGHKDGEFTVYDPSGQSIIRGYFESDSLISSTYFQKGHDGTDTVHMDQLPATWLNTIQIKESFQQAKYIRKRDYSQLSNILNPIPQPSDSFLLDDNGTRHSFSIVEDPAKFPGGMSAFGRILSRFLYYPTQARENGISGKVFVQFYIAPDGAIQNVEVVKGIGGGCDEAAVWAIQQMPDWKPAYQRGEAVSSRMVIPITFN